MFIHRAQARLTFAPARYRAYTQESLWCHEFQGAWRDLPPGGMSLACEQGRTNENASPYLALSQGEGQPAVAFNLIPNGNWSIHLRTATVLSSLPYLCVEMGLADENLSLELPPGTTLELPAILMQSLPDGRVEGSHRALASLPAKAPFHPQPRRTPDRLQHVDGVLRSGHHHARSDARPGRRRQGNRLRDFRGGRRLVRLRRLRCAGGGRRLAGMRPPVFSWWLESLRRRGEVRRTGLRPLDGTRARQQENPGQTGTPGMVPRRTRRPRKTGGLRLAQGGNAPAHRDLRLGLDEDRLQLPRRRGCRYRRGLHLHPGLVSPIS